MARAPVGREAFGIAASCVRKPIASNGAECGFQTSLPRARGKRAADPSVIAKGGARQSLRVWISGNLAYISWSDIGMSGLSIPIGFIPLLGFMPLAFPEQPMPFIPAPPFMPLCM